MSPFPYSARNLSIWASFCAGSVAALISASALSSGVPAPIETRLPICAPSRGASAKLMTTVTRIIRERRMVCLLLRNAGADRGRGYQDRGREETSRLNLAEQSAIDWLEQKDS